MTEQEFASLEPGDLVHHPAEPEKVWTVVGRNFHQGLPLAVLGKCNMNNHLWVALLGLSEEKCRELAKRYDLTVARMINPGNWTKAKNT